MPQLATIAVFGFKEFNPPTLLPIYKRLGCVTCQFHENPASKPDPGEARRVIADTGLKLDSIHGVFGPDFDPSCPDEPVRRSAVETYRREGDLARTLGTNMVVVHPGPISKDPGRITAESRAARVDPMRKSMEELAEIGRASGVVYLFENIPPNYEFGSDAAQLAGLLRRVNHPNARMCFDTGHAHMMGAAASALENCRDVISYTHVHDNDSTADSHQIPGRGTLAWEDYSRAAAKLPRETPAMLELFEAEATLEAQIKDGLPGRLRKWLAL